MLAASLSEVRQTGDQVTVILGMLEDKDSAAFASQLLDVVDHWILVGLQDERGMAAGELQRRLAELLVAEQCFETMNDALDQLLISAGDKDIILVTGSFVTVESFQQALSNRTH